MARKRGNNEGSIFKLPNGKWRAQVSLQGKRLSKTCNTQRECQNWLKKTGRQIDDGLSFAYTRLRLDEYLAGWSASTKTVLSRSTWAHYNQLVRSYINPNLGFVKIKDLRPEQIQNLYNQLIDQHVSVHTVRKIHITLHSALAQAFRQSMIPRNPASLVKPPRQPATEMAVLNESQVSQMLVTAKGHRWEALYHLAVISGMRQMELLGLKWTDLDWIRQVLRVERQLIRPGKHGVQFSSPKTRFGKRAIALGGRTIEILRGHYDRQQMERLAAGNNWHEHGLIFTNSLGGPIDPRNLLRDYKRLLHESGLPNIRFHDLRHTAASLMLNNGVPPIVVSRRLGHSKASITLDVYGHLIPTMQTEVAEMIDELVIPIALQRAPIKADH
jgi:integrase